MREIRNEVEVPAQLHTGVDFLFFFLFILGNFVTGFGSFALLQLSRLAIYGGTGTRGGG